MTTKEEVERLAAWLESAITDYEPEDHQAAALLRQQAAEIERLNLKLLSASEGTKDREHAEAYFRQAEKLLTSNEATLHAELDKANTLLRQALEALSAVQGVVASRGVALYPVINEIKTHLGEQT